ncbi:MAG: CpXC domain-containing protein [Sutterella wadsworthensis]|nr:CpXC domain-containing protein [Sutterella wadsworthensis]
MSNAYSTTLTCPHCHQAFDATVDRTIDAETDSDLLRLILEGTYGQTTCPHCLTKLYADTPLTVTDREHGTTLEFTATTDPIVVQRTAEHLMATIAERSANQQYRLVMHFDDLREKLIMLKSGLDDRVVEVMKFAAAKKRREIKPNETFDRVMFYRRSGEGFLVFLDNLSRTVAEVPFKRTTYQAVKARMTLTGSPLLVNGAWVMQYLEKHPWPMD